MRPHIASARLAEIHDLLLNRFGPQHWWPRSVPAKNGFSRRKGPAPALEVCVGAILTQNTSWINVAQAVANLKRETRIGIAPLLAVHPRRFETLIRPSGYFRQKAARLRGFLQWLAKRDGGWRSWLAHAPLDEARAALLAVHGIGPETADSILLYAFHRPAFVIDAYTLRFGARYGLFAEHTKYDEARAWFMAHLPPGAARYNELHALIVRLGSEFCGAKPRCGECPLRGSCVTGNAPR